MDKRPLSEIRVVNLSPVSGFSFHFFNSLLIKRILNFDESNLEVVMVSIIDLFSILEKH